MPRHSGDALQWLAIPTSEISAFNAGAISRVRYRKIFEMGEMFASQNGTVVCNVIFADGSPDQIPLDQIHLSSKSRERFGYRD